MSKFYVRALDQHIGKRLKKLRKTHKLSLERLAEVIDVSQQQMSRYELGRNHLAGAHLYLLAEAFDVPVNYFYMYFDDTRSTTPFAKQHLPDNWPIAKSATKTTNWREKHAQEREALLGYYWRQLPSESVQEQVLRLLEVLALGE